MQSILKVISDKKAIILLNAIAKEQYYEGKSLAGDNLLAKSPTRTGTGTRTTKKKVVRLSSAKFQSSLIRFTKIGIVENKEGRYVLTQPGKMVYQYQTLIGNGLDNYRKLKIIDSLGIYDTDRVTNEARAEIIDSLIGNREMRDMLKF